MTSILTNNGAIVALKTLRGINMDLNKTQESISTGKRVNNAAQGSAVWAVSKIMETDEASFRTINDGLTVAGSVVASAVEGAEKIQEYLKGIKTRLEASFQPEQDTAANWSEIKELYGQIKSEIDSRQVNGVNLLKDVETTGKLPDAVKTAQDAVNAAVKAVDENVAAHAADPATPIETALVTAVTTAKETLAAAHETARAEDTNTSVTSTYKVLSSLDRSVGNENTTVSTIDISNANLASTVYNTLGEYFGSDKSVPDFTDATDTDFTDMLRAVETAISNTVKAGATPGAKQSRIEGQAKTVRSLADSLKTSIGALVDTNLEEASARLQALQTQQQLGIQSLSIANQAPGAVMALFR